MGRDQLGAQVYEDPGSRRLVPGAEYLSGDIRVKLDPASAVTAAARNWRSTSPRLSGR